MTLSHDDGVRQRVRKLEGAGYAVRAAIPERNRPDELNGAIPDIDATDPRGRLQRRIEEIETQESIDNPKDKQQRKKLEEYAERHGAIFKTYVCK